VENEMKKKSYSQIRAELKSLLFYFAKESDQPGLELQDVLREVINELHDEVKEVTQAGASLKLVTLNGSTLQ
jgi:hypothetical protein